MDKNLFGKTIKSLREQIGLSQSQLAEYLKIDQTALSEIESGERSIRLAELDKLAVLFLTDRKSLLDGSASAVPFRLTSQEDLTALASVNRIVLNQAEMEHLTHNLGLFL